MKMKLIIILKKTIGGTKLATVDQLKKELTQLSISILPVETSPNKNIQKSSSKNTHVTSRNLINTIMLNSDTHIIADEIILNYLNQHPSLVSKYLNQYGLYHVYYRSQDAATNPNENHSVIVLLKSFATEDEAHQWIISYGQHIIEELNDNYGTPMVLFIQYDKNSGLYDIGQEPTNEHLISAKMYPVYAFTDDAYKMLINEHIYLLGAEDVDTDFYDVIPYWIYYKSKKGIERGSDKKAMDKIEKAYKRTTKERGLQYEKDIKQYKTNPQQYIIDKLNKK